MIETRVCIDDTFGPFDCQLDPHNRWNGWLSPHFTLDVTRELSAQTLRMADEYGYDCTDTIHVIEGRADSQDALFGGLGDAAPQAAPGPLLVPTGGTWRDKAVTLDRPMSTRTTVETDGIVVPPILVPCEGRDGKKPMSVDDPLRTQTARLETALAYLPPFVIPMRGGGDKEKARHISAPLHTVSAGGNHHGLVTAPDHLLVPYYGNGRARELTEPIGALPTRDRYALVKAAVDFNIDDVLFRMLQPHEIARAMAFRAGYKIMGSKRHQVRQLGNAVTPGVAENLYCALYEAITGEELPRFAEGRGPLSMTLAA
ncbi:DNA cytosine methyltransferase [Actinacidiphila sp. DG2A-62]|uniref:DNA cytosine methyltransferase n=1 Tax=Actinacidiphila sp. DG2A-62 TaxID=3108821 RepID=UPI002DBB8B67|nr:DNA cytosine methyltransferase [Actinacidiphila sp. DG2A-62]MEC3995183.1 DNA cytosine methyltransferase [Actinacidiphila sp. DG2A-62]